MTLFINGRTLTDYYIAITTISCNISLRDGRKWQTDVITLLLQILVPMLTNYIMTITCNMTISLMDGRKY